jgi:hypothetical protein
MEFESTQNLASFTPLAEGNRFPIRVFDLLSIVKELFWWEQRESNSHGLATEGF